MITNYQEILRDMAKAMVGLKDPSQLLTVITQFLHDEMGVKNSAISVFDRENERYIFFDSRGKRRVPINLVKLDINSPLIQWFKENSYDHHAGDDAITLTDLDQLIKETTGEKKKESLEQVKKVLQDLGAIACFPGYFDGELLGILFVGEKEAGTKLTREESLFLETLAADASMAIQTANYQATLQQKVQHLKETLDLVHDLHAKDKEKYLQLIITMAHVVDAKDSYTRGHSAEVKRLGLATLKYLSLDFDEKRHQDFAAGLELHDFGKVGIPDSILKKPAALTDEELKVMRTHPEIGYDILSMHDDLKDIAKVARHHHECYDGTGYPDGLKGEAIPIEARILCVVDAFHAMYSDRPYRKGLALDICREELQNGAGKQFDPVVVDAFMKVIENDLFISE